jgi:uncharacterized membrane protein YecN with MAPEG domain
MSHPGKSEETIMQLTVTAFYASLLAIFALYLSFQAGTYRGKTGVSILYGDPVNLELAQRVRRHQNFLEYVPIAIILMLLIESNGGSTTFLHVVGVLLIVSRVAHNIGLRHDNMAHPGRAIGAGGTALVSLASAAYLLWISGRTMFG